MNLNSNRPPQIKFLIGAWTLLWVITSMALSFTLFALQFNQSAVLAGGMKAQSALLTGGRDEAIH